MFKGFATQHFVPKRNFSLYGFSKSKKLKKFFNKLKIILSFGGVMEKENKICNVCGKEESSESIYCGKCGNNLDKNRKKECKKCKKKINIEDMYCRYCGTSQNESNLSKYSIVGIVLSFIIIGPFCLIPLWISKNISKNAKILMSILIIVLSIVMIWSIIELVNKIMGQYQEMINLTM